MSDIIDVIFSSFLTKMLRELGKGDIIPDALLIAEMRLRYTVRFQDDAFVLVAV
jgi:hypothetical protein